MNFITRGRVKNIDHGQEFAIRQEAAARNASLFNISLSDDCLLRVTALGFHFPLA